MKSFLVILLIIFLTALFFCGVFITRYIDNELSMLNELNTSLSEMEAFFSSYEPTPYVNAASPVSPTADVSYTDSLYSFKAPEGFRIISHSENWNEQMLELLYHELKANTHGKEMDILYEIVLTPEVSDDSILGLFSPATIAMDFSFAHTALPSDFTVTIMRDAGQITLYGSDIYTSIESMAVCLSHEYGHLFTYYHMFNLDFDNLADTYYAGLRNASAHDLITAVYDDDFYRRNRHRYLSEVAAEDYVQIMGSPTTRQVASFIDVRQSLLYDAENPIVTTSFRNAFPQENMMLPLAGEIPGLREYFYSFTLTDPPYPTRQAQNITLDIREVPISHDLQTGYTTFTHYVLTWNMPYEDTVYTLAMYDPEGYTGWAHPIKTVFPGDEASAVIGSFTTMRGSRVYIMDDDIPNGSKVFYVSALLPDGTYYLSEKLYVTF